VAPVASSACLGLVRPPTTHSEYSRRIATAGLAGFAQQRYSPHEIMSFSKQMRALKAMRALDTPVFDPDHCPSETCHNLLRESSRR
jgi:hypothetical protein